jgi:hypothetical protein
MECERYHGSRGTHSSTTYSSCASIKNQDLTRFAAAPLDRVHETVSRRQSSFTAPNNKFRRKDLSRHGEWD